MEEWNNKYYKEAAREAEVRDAESLKIDRLEYRFGDIYVPAVLEVVLEAVDGNVDKAISIVSGILSCWQAFQDYARERQLSIRYNKGDNAFVLRQVRKGTRKPVYSSVHMGGRDEVLFWQDISGKYFTGRQLDVATAETAEPRASGVTASEEGIDLYASNRFIKPEKDNPYAFLNNGTERIRILRGELWLQRQKYFRGKAFVTLKEYAAYFGITPEEAQGDLAYIASKIGKQKDPDYIRPNMGEPELEGCWSKLDLLLKEIIMLDLEQNGVKKDEAVKIAGLVPDEAVKLEKALGEDAAYNKDVMLSWLVLSSPTIKQKLRIKTDDTKARLLRGREVVLENAQYHSFMKARTGGELISSQAKIAGLIELLDDEKDISLSVLKRLLQLVYEDESQVVYIVKYVSQLEGRKRHKIRTAFERVSHYLASDLLEKAGEGKTSTNQHLYN